MSGKNTVTVPNKQEPVFIVKKHNSATWVNGFNQ